MIIKMKKSLIIIFALFISFESFSQGSLSFYQLREFVPQTSNLQPAFIPDNGLTIGLPTNFGFIYQGDLTIQDLISKDPSNNNLSLDFDVTNEVASELNRFNFQANVNLLHLGLRTKVGAFSFFANLRTNFDFTLNKDLIEFLANGNGNSLESTLDFTGSAIGFNAYHEIGVGYANRYLDDKLTLGVRVKQVTGMYHASTQEGAGLSLTTNANDFSWNIAVQNGTVNTAGLDFLFNSDDYESSDMTSYMISNDNSSLAFDIGAKYRLYEGLEFEIAINDIGSINWKEQVINYNTEDASFTYNGISLRGTDDQADAIQDSLLNRFTSNETQNSFSTSLATSIFLSTSVYTTTKDRFSLTYFHRRSLNETPANIALSYNRKLGRKVVLGAVSSYLGSGRGLNLGFNAAANLGPIQTYIAMDNALLTLKPETHNKAQFRFGLNLMFGYKKWTSEEPVFRFNPFKELFKKKDNGEG